MKLINIITGVAFAGNTAAYYCYQNGWAWDHTQQLAAIDLVSQWCDAQDRRLFPIGYQFKTCDDKYDNGKHKLEIRMSNGFSTQQVLEADDCRAALNPIVLNCGQGGADDASIGWRGR